MIVADSNLVIALLLDHPQHEKARQLLETDADWHLPDWWQVEVANAFRNYHRIGSLTLADALVAIERAAHLFPVANTHPVDLTSTLRLACSFDLSAYDARFISLARTFRQRLVTEDTRLRRACPDDTCSLDEALSS